ncbi:11114_t:CDS:2 [Funneliformis caledonium]|uniref:11114_t:CDS:1 n=1 Tax=Funneliformis caledonium TaxID=1117310 RepID=A0A9N8WIE4_9GLOM|nr:11114_t:CDS:2 [Funneliformis caledonium]
MDETTIEGLSKAVQEVTVRTCGQENHDQNYYSMGRNLSPVLLLYQTTYQEGESRESDGVSHTRVEDSAQMDQKERNEKKVPSEHNECNIVDTEQDHRSALFSKQQKVRETRLEELKMLRSMSPTSSTLTEEESEECEVPWEIAPNISRGRRCKKNQVEMFTSELNLQHVAVSVYHRPCKVSNLNDCMNVKSAPYEYVKDYDASLPLRNPLEETATNTGMMTMWHGDERLTAHLKIKQNFIY